MADKNSGDIKRIYYNNKRSEKVTIVFEGIEQGTEFIWTGTLKEAQDAGLIGNYCIKRKNETVS